MESDIVGISIQDEEDDAWLCDVNDEVPGFDMGLCLVGCFLMASVVNFEAMRNSMANLRHFLGGVAISDLGEKKFLFRFFSKVDIMRVITGSSWTFNNPLLVCQRLVNEEDPLQITLAYVDYWVQRAGLPSDLFSDQMAKQFGSFLGTFLDYDAKSIALGVKNFIESFYPIRIDHGAKELHMRWDITLKALPHQASPQNNIWLQEVDNLFGQSSGIVSNPSIYALGINSTSNFVKMIGKRMGLNLGGVADKLKEDAMDNLVQDREGMEVMGIFHGNHRWRWWMGIKGKGATGHYEFPELKCPWTRESVEHSAGFLFGIDVFALGSQSELLMGKMQYCNFTRFYGALDEHTRGDLWDLLWQLGFDQSLPWLVVVDFNEMPSLLRKKGERVWQDCQIKEFHSILSYYNFFSLGYSGQWFTWERGPLQGKNIQDRLDQYVVNPS
ncbi:hypothetical protein Golob_022912 [Gossypium lobatum]|uniref:DUF4283 domain-containing protein n=1 Tax=Gossypium lobatum TaxID=34289 RepID=A0A7J8LI50_9ROSI|nr:hypothetical protein [Gossypium lobatum]